MPPVSSPSDAEAVTAERAAELTEHIGFPTAPRALSPEVLRDVAESVIALIVTTE